MSLWKNKDPERFAASMASNRSGFGSLFRDYFAIQLRSLSFGLASVPQSFGEPAKEWPQEGQTVESTEVVHPQEWHLFPPAFADDAARFTAGVPQYGQKTTPFSSACPQDTQRSPSERFVPQLVQNRALAGISEPHEGHLHLLVRAVEGIGKCVNVSSRSIVRTNAPTAKTTQSIPDLPRCKILRSMDGLKLMSK